MFCRRIKSLSKSKLFALFHIVAMGLIVGCSDDDSPSSAPFANACYYWCLNSTSENLLIVLSPGEGWIAASADTLVSEAGSDIALGEAYGTASEFPNLLDVLSAFSVYSAGDDSLVFERNPVILGDWTVNAVSTDVRHYVLVLDEALLEDVAKHQPVEQFD